MVVIGAGVGGVTAAALLAKRSFDVTVLEGQGYHKGFRFDTGATIVGGFQTNGLHTLAASTLGIQLNVVRQEPPQVMDQFVSVILTKSPTGHTMQTTRGRMCALSLNR